MSQLLIMIAAVLGGLGVAAGAFGAHGLRGRLDPELLEIFETGVRYQMYHALALLAMAWLAHLRPRRIIAAAGWFFVVGVLIFSGSLYILALSGVRTWGAVTPVGGVALLIGWSLLAWSACSSRQ